MFAVFELQESRLGKLPQILHDNVVSYQLFNHTDDIRRRYPKHHFSKYSLTRNSWIWMYTKHDNQIQMKDRKMVVDMWSDSLDTKIKELRQVRLDMLLD